MITLYIPHILELSVEKDDKLLDLDVPSTVASNILKTTTHTLNRDTCNSTLKSGQKMEWSNRKFEYNIRFVALNSAKST